MQWINLPRTDPIWEGQFTVTTEPHRPLDFDGDYLMTVSGKTVYWWDISAWDTVTQTLVSMVPYKSVGLFDVSQGIQDITIDTTNDRLWVLTTDNELQRYDLEPYVSGIPQNNTCKAIVALSPVADMTHGTNTTLNFQVLDMWGVLTKSPIEVEFIATATENGAFYGKMYDGTTEAQRVTKTSSNGLISVVYRNKLTDTPISGNESIIARVA